LLSRGNHGQFVRAYENPMQPNHGCHGCEQRETDADSRGETRRLSMASTARPNLGRHLRLAAAGAAVATVLTAATAAASPVTPMEVQAPGMSRPGVSPSRDTGTRGPVPGFVLERGRFKPVALPRGLEDLAPQGISPMGINDRGQLVGEYQDQDGVDHGFLLDRGDRFTRIDVPGAKGTEAIKLNNRGQIVGAYSDTSTVLEPPEVPKRSFLLERGRLTRLDPPGAVSSQALGINDRGQVVGEYLDATGRYHGYVWERGRFATIDVPGTAGTSAADINNRGQVTGLTGDAAAPDGFLLDRGRFTTFDAPGAAITFASGLDDRGRVVGFSTNDLTGTSFSGFLRDPRGRFTAINRPGKSITLVFDINNRGQLVGVADNPEDLADAQPADPPPMGRMTPAPAAR
jgi:probable HAF family extracellular repeat protein